MEFLPIASARQDSRKLFAEAYYFNFASNLACNEKRTATESLCRILVSLRLYVRFSLEQRPQWNRQQMGTARMNRHHFDIG